MKQLDNTPSSRSGRGRSPRASRGRIAAIEQSEWSEAQSPSVARSERSHRAAVEVEGTVVERGEVVEDAVVGDAVPERGELVEGAVIGDAVPERGELVEGAVVGDAVPARRAGRRRSGRRCSPRARRGGRCEVLECDEINVGTNTVDV
jgi:hypothetical protein